MNDLNETILHAERVQRAKSEIDRLMVLDEKGQLCGYGVGTLGRWITHLNDLESRESI